MAYTKVIQSGNLVEEWVYEREPSPKSHIQLKPRRKRILQERRPDHIIKCRKDFTRLVRANLNPQWPPALMTLTMRDIVDISDAYKLYTAFGRKLKKHYGDEIAWIAVPEFQKRGAVHFHVLLFNFHDSHIKSERRTRRMAGYWGHGFVDLVKTDGSEKLSGYLAKYMSKAMSDHRLVGKRAYSASRNVLRPVSLNTPFQIKFAKQIWGLAVDNSPLQEREYSTMFLGKCVYKSYLIDAYVGRENSADVA